MTTKVVRCKTLNLKPFSLMICWFEIEAYPSHITSSPSVIASRQHANNERLIERIAESYPVRRAAQLTVYLFQRSKSIMEDTGAKDKAVKFKHRFSDELKKEWEKARGGNTVSYPGMSYLSFHWPMCLPELGDGLIVVSPKNETLPKIMYIEEKLCTNLCMDEEDDDDTSAVSFQGSLKKSTPESKRFVNHLECNNCKNSMKDKYAHQRSYMHEARKTSDKKKLKQKVWNRMSDYIVVKAKKNNFEKSSNYTTDASSDEYELCRKNLSGKKMSATSSTSLLKVALAMIFISLVLTNVYLQREIYGLRKAVKCLEGKFQGYDSNKGMLPLLSVFNPKASEIDPDIPLSHDNFNLLMFMTSWSESMIESFVQMKEGVSTWIDEMWIGIVASESNSSHPSSIHRPCSLSWSDEIIEWLASITTTVDDDMWTGVQISVNSQHPNQLSDSGCADPIKESTSSWSDEIIQWINQTTKEVTTWVEDVWTQMFESVFS
ncbi:hypothetical protein Ocin01_11157 [Orchesella cincta]|uniref:Uncharacterized protein n=1 Tax=Orchesella cincta TaxID=48709 RepID=A0A1D2MS26_ORCCI|nr:hypothetical protein Ocin01_11157 [Orchesella cincta]